MNSKAKNPPLSLRYLLGMHAAALLCFALAGMSNAVMDTIKHHWERSVFNEWEEPYRTFMRSDWKHKYVNNDPATNSFKPVFGKITIQHIEPVCDGWHLFQTCMFIFFWLATVWFPPRPARWWQTRELLFVCIAYTIALNGPFNLFYDSLLLARN